MIQSQISQAEVDLLTGAFQYKIPNTTLDYSSRRAETTKLGFGWAGTLPRNAKTKLLNGDLIKVDLNKQIWLFQYDALHNLTEIKLPTGETTRITYHGAQDRTQSLKTDRGCKESFSYVEERQTLQLEATKSCPGQGTETVKLKAAYSGPRRQLERVAWQKQDERFGTKNLSKGSIIYDELGRLAFYVMDDDLISYEYDASGGVAAITRGNSRVQFNYDPKGRLSQIITDQKNEINLKYDTSGRLQSLDESTLAVASALEAALENLLPIEGGLSL